MPRTKRPFRQRPITLKEMNESLETWNPALEEYNKKLRELDTPEEKLLQQQGRETYAARLARRRKELKVAAALPTCPITAEKPTRRVSNYSIVEAIARIPGLPRMACTVLQSVGRHWNIELEDSWRGKKGTATDCGCSEHSVSDYWTLLERANYIRSKTGTDRKGDSRLRPDKPRAGGQKRTNHWWLNVNGIFALAYPKTELEPANQETTSPFEPCGGQTNQETTTAKQETTTTNQEVASENQETTSANQVVVSSDSSSYPNTEKKREKKREQEGSKAASPEPSDSHSRPAATSEKRKHPSQRRPWVQKIWKVEHDTTVIAAPEDNMRLEELITEHSEPVLIRSWHSYVTEKTDDDSGHYAHYTVKPVEHVEKKISKAGKPWFDTATSTAEITRRPFRAFLAPDVVQSLIDGAKLEDPEQLQKFAAQYVRN